MGRQRRKRGQHGERDPNDTPKAVPAPAATTSLGSLLKAAKVEVGKPHARTRSEPQAAAAQRTPVVPPQPPKTGAISPAAELRMLNDAYAGAQPLSRKSARIIEPRPERKRVTEAERAEELAARKRLAELVSGGVHFKIQREDEFVRAYRSESSRKLIDKLGGQGFVPEATLDLHGERTARLSDHVSAFVRAHHRRGARHLLIIVGKGLHSEDGNGVLLPALIEALTQGLCAPLVRGFSSAHARLGGSGAVAVLLI